MTCECFTTDASHPMPAYNAEHDNYYCPLCKAGQGNTYHAMARGLEKQRDDALLAEARALLAEARADLAERKLAMTRGLLSRWAF